jgi:hypothetical protein
MALASAGSSQPLEGTPMSDTTTTRKEIADWIGDIVALESHVEEALDHQLTIDPPHGELKTTIQYLHDTCRDSKQRRGLPGGIRLHRRQPGDQGRK